MILSTSTQGLPNPKYQKWVEQGIQRLRKAGFTDQEIRNEWLMGEQQMADTTADRFIPMQTPPPAAPVQPPGSPTLDYATKMFSGDIFGMLSQVLGTQGPDALKNLGGAAASAARGVTLGATDYVPPLKNMAAEYRKNRPGAAFGVELTGGALNPFKWLKGFGGVVGKVGQFMAPGAAPVQSGLKAGAKRVLGQGARGATYGGIYGFNTAEGDIGDRAAPAAFGTVFGGALGTTLGTGVELLGSKGTNQAMRAQTGLSPKSRDIIAKAQTEQGALRDPQAIQPGEMLIDNAGPLEKSLVHEALRRSSTGLALANRLKTEWVAGQKDAPLGLALEVAGLPPQAGGRFPNPLLLAKGLRTSAKAEAAPLYARLNAENVSLPKTPELDAALESPTFREFLTSKDFQRFAADRAAAEKIRGLTGKSGRGVLMSAEQIEKAIGGADPAIEQMVAKARQIMGVLDPTTEAAIRGSAKGLTAPAPTFDWRTLHAAKLAIDESLKRSEDAVGSLKLMKRGDLLATRDALMRTLKKAPGYEDALRKYAGGHVEAEMLEAGQAAARKGPNEVEALLLDPKTAEQGEGALNQARFGVLAELHGQLRNATEEALTSGQVWTPGRVAMLKLVAASPQQAASVDAFVNAQQMRWNAFSIVPKQVSGIQTRGPEQMEGALAGIAGAGTLGSGLGFRVGNIMQRLMSKISSAEAYDIVRTYFSSNPGKAMEAIMGAFPRDASRVGEMSGRAVGIGVGSLQP